MILERKDLVANFRVAFVHEHLSFEEELLVAEERTMNRFRRVVFESSLRLIVNHSEHVVAVLIVSLTGNEETSSECASSSFSNSDLPRRGIERCRIVREGGKSGQRLTFVSRKAVQRLSRRSGTLS